MDNFQDIVKPTLILNKERALRNIERIASKARKSGVRFRPHFKTHQSAEIGEWFKEFNVKGITVSSLDMAIYFAKNGWNDITVAFPANIRELKKMNHLAEQIQLNLLVESKETVQYLAQNLKSAVNIWIKIDTGYRRTGIQWDHFEEIAQLTKQIEQASSLTFSGILTHSGHSYKAVLKQEIKEIYSDTVSKMKQVKERLISTGTERIEISIGDTPCCSIVEDFSEVDEIRPGNFVFYDVMQLAIGSCSEEDIAVAIACPVVAKHEDRHEIVIYGGAVHLSKDSIMENRKRIFGKIALPTPTGWSSILPDCYVCALSQEHGIVKATDDLFGKTKIGDLLMVLPIHSCLTVDLMQEYHTIE